MSGTAPLTVQFTDLSLYWNRDDATAAISSWLWDFGDGTTSAEKNPSHTYARAGLYTVRLTINDGLGHVNTETKTGSSRWTRQLPLRAEFTATPRMGTMKTAVSSLTRAPVDITGGCGISATAPPRVMKGIRCMQYTRSGRFNVKLTVRNAAGTTTQQTESSFITNFAASEYVDNTFIEKPHYYAESYGFLFGKTILDMANHRMLPEEFKFKRLAYGGCNASAYYLEPFARGIVFFTTSDETEVAAPRYLRSYLLGDSDDEILNRSQ